MELCDIFSFLSKVPIRAVWEKRLGVTFLTMRARDFFESCRGLYEKTTKFQFGIKYFSGVVIRTAHVDTSRNYLIFASKGLQRVQNVCEGVYKGSAM